MKMGPESGALTPREREILALIAQGLNSRQIASRLGIAYFTVRKHRSNILAKLQLHDAPQLSAHAARIAAGLLPLDRASQQPGAP
jgi:DNA-binding CsgD family transcriptional regulator